MSDFPSADEKGVFVILGDLLFRRVLLRCRMRGPLLTGLYHGESVRSHDRALRVLAGAGLFCLVSDAERLGGVRPGATYEMAVEPENAAARLSARAQRLAPADLSEAIAAFVDLFSEFSDPGFPPVEIGRQPFVVAVEYEAAFAALERCGYAARRGPEMSGNMAWTDRMVPVMFRLGFWCEAGRSWHEEPFDSRG